MSKTPAFGVGSWLNGNISNHVVLCCIVNLDSLGCTRQNPWEESSDEEELGSEQTVEKSTLIGLQASRRANQNISLVIAADLATVACTSISIFVVCCVCHSPFWLVLGLWAQHWLSQVVAAWRTHS